MSFTLISDCFYIILYRLSIITGINIYRNIQEQRHCHTVCGEQSVFHSTAGKHDFANIWKQGKHNYESKILSHICHIILAISALSSVSITTVKSLPSQYCKSPLPTQIALDKFATIPLASCFLLKFNQLNGLQTSCPFFCHF